MSTQRYKLTLAYRGTHYHGWQTQLPTTTWKGPTPPDGHGIPTIQSEITRALAGVLNHPVSIHGSSRTDAGVHAKGQVAHFDTFRTQIPTEGLRRAVNHRLPDDFPDLQLPEKSERRSEGLPDREWASQSGWCRWRSKRASGHWSLKRHGNRSRESASRRRGRVFWPRLARGSTRRCGSVWA